MKAKQDKISNIVFIAIAIIVIVWIVSVVKVGKDIVQPKQEQIDSVVD